MKHFKLIAFGTLFIYAVSVGLYSHFVPKIHGTFENAGQYGDMFGAFSGIVNGLALVALAYTIYLQLRELQTQNDNNRQQLEELRISNSSHIVNTLELLYHRWHSRSMLFARNEVCNQYIDNELKECTTHMEHIADYFEYMGILTKAQHIDDDLIWESYSQEIEAYWNMFSSWINRFQKNDSSSYSCFTELRRKVSEISKLKGVPDFVAHPNHIKEFAQKDIEYSKFMLSFQYGIESHERPKILTGDPSEAENPGVKN